MSMCPLSGIELNMHCWKFGKSFIWQAAKNWSSDTYNKQMGPNNDKKWYIVLTCHLLLVLNKSLMNFMVVTVVVKFQEEKEDREVILRNFQVFATVKDDVKRIL